MKNDVLRIPQHDLIIIPYLWPFCATVLMPIYGNSFHKEANRVWRCVNMTGFSLPEHITWTWSVFLIHEQLFKEFCFQIMTSSLQFLIHHQTELICKTFYAYGAHIHLYLIQVSIISDSIIQPIYNQTFRNVLISWLRHCSLWKLITNILTHILQILVNMHAYFRIMFMMRIKLLLWKHSPERGYFIV